MLFKLINKNGAILKTKNTYMPKDICIEIDEAVLGVKTDDATAEPVDIIAGKTAYVNGEKITGTMADYIGEYEGNIAIGIRPEGNLELTSTEEVDVTNYATVSINEPNLKAENIRKDVSILGISGICRPYEEPKLQEKTVSQNGEVTPDEGYDGLSKVIVDMSGYENRLKKFIDGTGSCNSLFYDRDDLTTAADISKYLSYSDTSNAVSMNKMFYYCRNLVSVPQLDTSKVTNMKSMFESCTSLTTVPQLDTSKVTNMENMFYFCVSLITIPSLNASKVTTLSHFADQCKKLTSLPKLDTASVTNWSCAFRSCLVLEKIDISNFTSPRSDATYSTQQIFSWCHSLKTIIIRSFGNNYIINSNAFDNCYHLTGTVNSQYNPNGDKDCYIYVPREMVDTLKSTAVWSDHANQIRALEDYTVDGTTTGELDESKI